MISTFEVSTQITYPVVIQKGNLLASYPKNHVTVLKILIVIYVILQSYQSGNSQTFKPAVLGQMNQISLPFEYVNGFIVVDVVFQKMMPLKFILDTGAENTILLKREFAAMLNLPYHKRIKLLGADMSQEVYAYVCNGTFLQLANTSTVRHNIIVLEDDYLYLEEYTGTKIDGILGAEFFKGLMMRIDYKSQTITIAESKSPLTGKLKNYNSFDLQMISHKPYINCITEVNPGKPVNTRLLIDTGAGLSVLFHHNTDSLMELKGNLIKGNLGKGIGGDIDGFSGKVHSFKIGNLTFNNMISSFQTLESVVLSKDKVIRNGLIGNLLLERFDVIIDFIHDKLYLKPMKNYNKAFEYDKSGITFFAFGEKLNQYYIKYISDNSPAYEADLRPGDVILKVGFFSYKWFTLKQLNNKFSGKSGKIIKLKIKRENQILTKEIILRDLFGESITNQL